MSILLLSRVTCGAKAAKGEVTNLMSGCARRFKITLGLLAVDVVQTIRKSHGSYDNFPYSNGHVLGDPHFPDTPLPQRDAKMGQDDESNGHGSSDLMLGG